MIWDIPIVVRRQEGDEIHIYTVNAEGQRYGTYIIKCAVSGAVKKVEKIEAAKNYLVCTPLQ
jgi:glutamate formiminotransferase